MVLWTIQSIGAWKKLQRCGVLCADPRYADKDMRPAYKWMAAQMQKRVALKPFDNLLPIWARKKSERFKHLLRSNDDV
jgi:hypothetical protein